jgi:hypothetical protein
MELGPRVVDAPNGRTWRVGREWLPRRRVRVPRGRGDRGLLDWLDPSTLVDDFSAGGILAGIAVVLALVIALFVVWPIVAIAIEVVLLVVLFLAGLAGRVVLRRPWRVVARTGPPWREVTHDVVGWRASGEAIDAMAAAIAAGREPA